MRIRYPSSIYLILNLTLLALPNIALANYTPEETSVDDGPSPTPLLSTSPDAATVCAPLKEARTILRELQPPQNAHLDAKVGGAIGPFGSRGWGDGLGWANEVSRSTQDVI